jgi:hypothetical protein
VVVWDGMASTDLELHCRGDRELASEVRSRPVRGDEVLVLCIDGADRRLETVGLDPRGGAR